ncbi:MAG TPA: hypothetical protein VE487_09745 [Ilumatobacter sp.]|nr:hypothetical protein [Ilumatobacter sp.]
MAAGAGMVVLLVVVVAVVVGDEVVAVTVDVDAGAVEVTITSWVVWVLVVGAGAGGRVVVVLVGEPAAPSVHAETVSTPASTAFDNALRRPMRGDHTEHPRAVPLTMLTIHVTISIDTDTDRESADILGERLKDVVWKEVYENMQLPASVATAYAEVS